MRSGRGRRLLEIPSIARALTWNINRLRPTVSLTSQAPTNRVSPVSKRRQSGWEWRREFLGDEIYALLVHLPLLFVNDSSSSKTKVNFSPSLLARLHNFIYTLECSDSNPSESMISPRLSPAIQNAPFGRHLNLFQAARPTHNQIHSVSTSFY